jgi:hypothetical protein
MWRGLFRQLRDQLWPSGFHDGDARHTDNRQRGRSAGRAQNAVDRLADPSRIRNISTSEERA